MGRCAVPCRVGYTHDPEERKSYWRGQHPLTFGAWEVLGEYNTKREALDAEEAFANKYNCKWGSGGDDPATPPDKWSVYYFRF